MLDYIGTCCLSDYLSICHLDPPFLQCHFIVTAPQTWAMNKSVKFSSPLPVVVVVQPASLRDPSAFLQHGSSFTMWYNNKSCTENLTSTRKMFSVLNCEIQRTVTCYITHKKYLMEITVVEEKYSSLSKYCNYLQVAGNSKQ